MLIFTADLKDEADLNPDLEESEILLVESIGR